MSILPFMRTFVKMRTWASNNQELATRLHNLEAKFDNHETDIDTLFDLFVQVSADKQAPPRVLIGFKK